MFPAWAAAALGLLREGLQSNWWGLSCPSHCQSPGFGFLAVVYLLGCSSGALAVVCLGASYYWGFWGLGPPAPLVARAEASSLRPRTARLRGYLHAEG